MKIEKRNLVEIKFSDSEIEILQQAQDVLTQLFNSTNGNLLNLLIDQRTGECFRREDIKSAISTLGNLAYSDYSSWLFEIN